MPWTLEDFLHRCNEKITQLEYEKHQVIRDVVESFFGEYPFINSVNVHTALYRDSSTGLQEIVVTKITVDYDESSVTDNPDLRETLREISAGRWDLEVSEVDQLNLGLVFADLCRSCLGLGVNTFDRKVWYTQRRAERQAAVDALIQQSQELGLYD